MRMFALHRVPMQGQCNTGRGIRAPDAHVIQHQLVNFLPQLVQRNTGLGNRAPDAHPGPVFRCPCTSRRLARPHASNCRLLM